jgi:hypothetical protein
VLRPFSSAQDPLRWRDGDWRLTRGRGLRRTQSSACRPGSWQEVINVQNPDGTYTEVDFAVIEPDPLWEDITLDFHVPAERVTWIGNLRIASACAP